jgi:hypothetical protein
MKNLRKYTEVVLGEPLSSAYREELFATGVTRKCIPERKTFDNVYLTIKLNREEVIITVPLDKCILMKKTLATRKWTHVVWIDKRYFMREIKYA